MVSVHSRKTLTKTPSQLESRIQIKSNVDGMSVAVMSGKYHSVRDLYNHMVSLS